MTRCFRWHTHAHPINVFWFIYYDWSPRCWLLCCRLAVFVCFWHYVKRCRLEVSSCLSNSSNASEIKPTDGISFHSRQTGHTSHRGGTDWDAHKSHVGQGGQTGLRFQGTFCMAHPRRKIPCLYTDLWWFMEWMSERTPTFNIWPRACKTVTKSQCQQQFVCPDRAAIWAGRMNIG